MNVKDIMFIIGISIVSLGFLTVCVFAGLSMLKEKGKNDN